MSCKHLVGESFEVYDIHERPRTKVPPHPLLKLQQRCVEECDAAHTFLPCFFACIKDSLYTDAVHKGLAKCKSCAESVVACGLAKCGKCHAGFQYFDARECFECTFEKCYADKMRKCGRDVCSMELLA